MSMMPAGMFPPGPLAELIRIRHLRSRWEQSTLSGFLCYIGIGRRFVIESI